MSREGRFSLVIPQALTVEGVYFAPWALFLFVLKYSRDGLSEFFESFALCNKFENCPQKMLIRSQVLFVHSFLPTKIQLFGFTTPDILSRTRSLSGNLCAHRPRRESKGNYEGFSYRLSPYPPAEPFRLAVCM